MMMMMIDDLFQYATTSMLRGSFLCDDGLAFILTSDVKYTNYCVYIL